MTKTWFVTGSSRGLGRVLVEEVLASGDKVVATARTSAHLDDLAKQYGPDKLLTLSLDVTNVAQTIKAASIAKATFGTVDIVVNNAGYADIASIEDMTLKSFRDQFETNFFGVVNVTKAFLPILREQGSGHIMQVSSVGGRVGSPGLGSYQSAKWAVGGFSTVLANEVEPLGIKVTVLEPGGMKTDWAGSSMGFSAVSEPYQATVGKMTELRAQAMDNWTEPVPIAKAIIHVANVEQPPRRLLLGRDTVNIAKKAAADLIKSDEEWEHVTRLEV